MSNNKKNNTDSAPLKNKINIRVIKLNAVLPPVPKEDKNSDIVYFGDDNRFPDYLLTLSNLTGLHTAILDKKIKMTIGDGITYDGNDDATTDNFIANPNPDESLDEILLKCTTDLEIFGGFYLQAIWNKDKTSISIYHQPFQSVRCGKADDKGKIDTFYIKDEWKKYDKVKDATVIAAFDGKFTASAQLIRCYKYNPINKYYPIPSYIGATTDIDTLFQISNFHNNAIRNNFNPGAVFIFRGPEPTEEEMDVIVKNIEKKYQGSNNAGTPLIMFLDNEQQEPKFEQMQITDLDKLFQELSNTAKENITLSHSIPRIVAGLEKPGQLGGSKEIIEANLIFFNDYVKKEQQFLLNQINKIGKINGIQELLIKNSNPSLVLYSESLLQKVLTVSEIRAIFGYDNITTTQTTIE